MFNPTEKQITINGVPFTQVCEALNILSPIPNDDLLRLRGIFPKVGGFSEASKKDLVAPQGGSFSNYKIPMTNRILEMMENGETRRSKIRETLKREGYNLNGFGKSICRLRDRKVIENEGTESLRMVGGRERKARVQEKPSVLPVKTDKPPHYRYDEVGVHFEKNEQNTQSPVVQNLRYAR